MTSFKFGSKGHRDFIKSSRQQKIDRANLYCPEKCLDEIIDFLKKAVKGEPIAEKIAVEAIVRCDSREGMITNRRFYQDYLEAITGKPQGNPGHNIETLRFGDIQCTLQELNIALKKDDAGQELTLREEAIIKARLIWKSEKHRAFMEEIFSKPSAPDVPDVIDGGKHGRR